MRICTKCSISKPLIEANFRIDRRRSAFSRQCRKCETKRNLEYYAGRIEKNRAHPPLRPDTKWCNICKTTKPGTEFCRSANGRDGFEYRCTSCKHKANYARNKARQG